LASLPKGFLFWAARFTLKLLSADRKITLEFFMQSKIKITMPVLMISGDLLNPFEMIFACGILRSGFKTFNRAQGQGRLGLPAAGISGIFRGLAVTVQHGD
jgi:hypothetical protein